MGYKVTFQTEQKYRSVQYGHGTIYSSACGPASLCNALRVLHIADVSLPDMCRLAEQCGARVQGGTYMPPLLKAAAQRYSFTFETTSKNAQLTAHLKAGGAAILHAGSAHKLFSNSGHFVCAAAVSGDTATILDSYWYSGKYTASSLRRNHVNVVARGVIQTSIAQCGKATSDRSPSYYLISKQQPASTPQIEEDEMTYYETLAEIPSYYRDAVKFLTDSGIISGTGDGKLHLSEDICRVLTILYKGDYLHTPTQYFDTVDTLPAYSRDTIQKLINNKALSGIDSEKLHLSEDMCRILTILDRAQH